MVNTDYGAAGNDCSGLCVVEGLGCGDSVLIRRSSIPHSPK